MRNDGTESRQQEAFRLAVDFGAVVAGKGSTAGHGRLLRRNGFPHVESG
jgi:hypothetical protein